MLGYIVTLLTVVTLATAAPPDLVSGLRQSFGSIDTNGDGMATIDEFNATLTTLDTDHNGKIVLREYAARSTADRLLTSRIFDYFDFDSDGHLDVDDLNVAFHQLDVNLDGGVSFREYSAAYQAIVALLLPATSQPVVG